MNEPNDELTELLELVKQDVDSYTWMIGTGPPPTEDRWGNPVREPVTEPLPDEPWVWADRCCRRIAANAEGAMAYEGAGHRIGDGPSTHAP